tara:strand:- start:54 stop:254 length:201 start_codon:yes stop_codon:yes gene_type:complete
MASPTTFSTCLLLFLIAAASSLYSQSDLPGGQESLMASVDAKRAAITTADWKNFMFILCIIFIKLF